MPLTAKEKQRRYRERKKQSGEYEQDKEKDRLRKKKARSDFKLKCSKRKWQNYRKIENERIKLCKLKTKAKMAQNQNNESINNGESSRKISYKSPQALGKAVKRVERSLPKSPRKQKSVVTAIAKSVGLVVCDDSSQPKRSSKKITVECEMAVNDYFLRDDISWQAPGKKDRVIIRDKSEDGSKSKTYLQKRYLRMSMKEIHQCFLNDYPDFSIGLTAFSQLKPKQIDFFGNLPHLVCMCRYHENMRLILEALKPYVGLPTSFKEFIDLVTCDSSKKSCMNRECDICKVAIDAFDPRNVVPALQNTVIKVHQWKNVEGATKKVEIQGINLNNLFELLKEQLKPFLIHTYIKRVQSKHFESLKSEVNMKKVVLQVDFSENFTFKYQNEIQSAHWANSQCTLFTGYAWVNDKEGKSYVLVSNCLDHGKTSVYTYMNILLKDLKISYPEIEEVQVFSDGASSQFKQKYLFSNLILLEKSCLVKLTWNYFATSHGKGTVDGIGGAVKGSVWRRMIANDIIINTAEEFVPIAKQCNPKIHIQFVSMSEINKNIILEERWHYVKAVPNTQRIHYVKPINENKILVSDESSGLDRNERVENIVEHHSDEGENNSDTTLRVGSFVKVRIASKLREQLFIAQITSLNYGDVGYEVRYLKKTENTKVFIDDEPKHYYIDYSDIIEPLEVPTIDNRGRYHFKNPIVV